MAKDTKMKVILGTGNVGPIDQDEIARFDTPEQVTALLDAFYDRGYRNLDTARMYSVHVPGTSEPRLGAANAGERFLIDTKVFSMNAGDHTGPNIDKSISDSLNALKISQVNTEYLHLPERTTPFEETLEAMDKAYRHGKFKAFGISNYSAADVEQMIEICDRRGFIKPTVYQGQYNAIVRSGEKELFPVLRKNNVAFYAYSPAAGGFFSGGHKNPKPGSRFDPKHFLGQTYGGIYRKPEVVKAADEALDIAKEVDVFGHAAALRWTAHHSILDPKLGDAVVIGASSVEQLHSNLDVIEQGPLPENLANAIGGIFAQLGDSAASYHM